jgi:hypothetical protein
MTRSTIAAFALGLMLAALPAAAGSPPPVGSPVGSPPAGKAPLGQAADDCTGNPWLLGWSPQWHALFQGIDWTAYCTTYLPTAIKTPGVRTQKVNALRIDLQNPNIQFVSTPEAVGGGTVGQVAAQFLCATGAQVAINASFTWGGCVNGNFAVLGLEKSLGQLVSNLASVPTALYAGSEALLITKENKASFETVIESTPARVYANAWTAVAGSPQPIAGSTCPPSSRVPGPPRLLLGGRIESDPGTDANPPEIVAARTAVGLSADRRYLFMMTIDGADHSTCGAGFYDEGAWLRQLGAADAINLDGGGSTVMAMADPQGGVKLLNHPASDHITTCQQRTVGVFLGVKTLPGTGFVPSGCCTTIACSAPTTSCCKGGPVPCQGQGLCPQGKP